MAIDSDFQKGSFCYAPLVPVTSFDNNQHYFKFTRSEGEYFAFSVKVANLNPKWFRKCMGYLKKNNLKIIREFDMEYYPINYVQDMMLDNFNFKDQMLQILFKKDNSVCI